MRFSALQFLIAACAGVVIGWWAWPVRFVPPPPFEQLEKTVGRVGFAPGRNEPILRIDGEVHLCYFSHSTGAIGSCVLQLRNEFGREVVARWYWHPHKWPFERMRLLLHVTDSTGVVLLSYDAQLEQLKRSALRTSTSNVAAAAWGGAVSAALILLLARRAHLTTRRSANDASVKEAME